MLQAVHPSTFESFPIRPSHDALSLLLVIDEGTLVYPSVDVAELALTVHLIVLKDSLVVAATWPDVLSEAFHLVVFEFTRIARLIEHSELAVAVAQSIFILALEVAVVPGFRSLAVLLILDPTALVAGAVGPHELTLTHTLVIFPVTYVIAAIRVDHTSMSVMFITGPVAIVALTIRPLLFTVAVPAQTTPLACVQCVLVFCLHLGPQRHHLVQLHKHLLAHLISIPVGAKPAMNFLESGLTVCTTIIERLPQHPFESKPVLGICWRNKHEYIWVDLQSPELLSS